MLCRSLHHVLKNIGLFSATTHTKLLHFRDLVGLRGCNLWLPAAVLLRCCRSAAETGKYLSQLTMHRCNEITQQESCEGDACKMPTSAGFCAEDHCHTDEAAPQDADSAAAMEDDAVAVRAAAGGRPGPGPLQRRRLPVRPQPSVVSACHLFFSLQPVILATLRRAVFVCCRC